MKVLTTRLLFASLTLFAVASCGGADEEELGAAQQGVGGASVSTDQASYTHGQDTTLTWSGLPGNTNDWVAITTAGSPADSGFVGYLFVNGQMSGSHVFSDLATGSYEARAYLDASYTILATSTFDVTGTNTTVSTSQSIYGNGQPITVSWDQLPGNNGDWVAITTAGAPADSGFARYAFVNGQVSGSMQFDGLAGGSYEARAYFNNTYTILATSPFLVSTAVVSTDQPSYGPGATVTMSWSGMPGNTNDWVAIVAAGSPPDSGFVPGDYAFINGATSGSLSFGGLPNGNYEARAYLNNTYQVLSSSAFAVTNASVTVTTDMSTYTATDPVTMSWSGMPGNTGDWVAIATAGSLDSSGFVQYEFINGQTSGSIDFGALPPGDYEARAYVNNSYTVLQRAAFSVTP